MEPTIKLYDEGLEGYPWSVVIIENLAIVIWLILGTLICLQFNSYFGWGYLGFAILMILVILRKMICMRCFYYGKRCHVGWGYFSKVLFKKGNIEEFQSCAGMKVVPVFYGIVAIIPVILGFILLIKNFSLFILIIFLIMLLAIIYSSVIARKKSCAQCKMRMLCPGSAAKEIE